MLYRKFPKIPQKEISVLGFGTMRLPTIDNDSIDEKKSTELFKSAYEHGVNYFDTAYPYHGGKSESVLGKALKELGIRQKVYIADKCPVWKIKTESDFETVFNEQLERLNTDYIDFYLLHALNEERFETVKKLNGLRYFERLKKEGKIKHFGFSFHAQLPVFKKIIDEYEHWEFCQIQYNYFDEHYQAGIDGINYAAQHQIGVISMEPLRGGILANPPSAVTDIFAHAAKPRLPAEWALRWVWENQHIVTALSGMDDYIQVDSNCAFAAAAKPNSLPASETAVIQKANDWLKSRMRVKCTNCRYCMPCPNNVQINEIFGEWNKQAIAGKFENGNKSVFSAQYAQFVQNKQDASMCTKCGKCQKLCPQNLPIIDLLQQAHSMLKHA